MRSTRDLVLSWLAGDVVLLRSRRVAYAVAAISIGSLSYACVMTRSMTAPLTSAKPPPALPPDRGDVRFGVPLAKRKAVFEELATAEPGSRAEGKRSFPGPDLEWSADDHRGALERHKAAAIASAHGLALSQVYLILDEGIREKWPGPDGEPLSPFTTPLHPRRKYGW